MRQPDCRPSLYGLGALVLSALCAIAAARPGAGPAPVTSG